MFDYSWKKGYFYRDRLSEVIDVMQDEYCTPALPLDFSPGYRYISKGGHLA
jgi:hypothetical protein